MIINRIVLILLFIPMALGGCADNNSAPDNLSADDSAYSDPVRWVCRPDIDGAICNRTLTTTVISTDNATSTTAINPDPEAAVDCFYIYPTVDFTGPIGNHEDFSDSENQALAVKMQAAWFSPVCRVFAPLYRQITFMTYSSAKVDKYLEIAYEDVREAFDYYYRNFNEGRPIIFIGHSQGSRMLRMLLQREIEQAPKKLSKMVAAYLVGASITTEKNSDRGGTFDLIPTCGAAEQTGCVVAYQSYARDYPPPPDLGPSGVADLVCVDPAGRHSDEPQTLVGAMFPAGLSYSGISLDLISGIDADYFIYPDYYAGRCRINESGAAWYEITVVAGEDDARSDPIPYGMPVVFSESMGLHLFDYNLPAAEILSATKTRIESYLTNR